MNTKYAYGYVRVSTDKQEELSPESQEKLLREYAKNHNMVLLDIFFEIGVSGRKADMIKDPGVDYETKGSFMRSLVKDIVYDKEKGQVIFHLYLSKPA